MAQQSPQDVPVEFFLHSLVANVLDLKGLPEVDGEVADEEERDEVTTRAAVLVHGGIGAPAEAVHDHGSLDHHLDELVEEGRRESKKWMSAHKVPAGEVSGSP